MAERSEQEADEEKLRLEASSLRDALIKLDGAAERVLEADAAGDDLGAALMALDEVRGRIWATYSPASDALKAADRAAAESPS